MIQMTGTLFNQTVTSAKKAVNSTPAAVQFKGIHPDAIVGGDIKLVDTSPYGGNHKKLFEDVKSVLNFSRINAAVPLITEVESNKGQPDRIVVKAPVGNTGNGVKLGYISDKLAEGLAPHIKKGTPLVAWLMGIRRRPNASTFDMKIRLEALNEAGKAPNLNVRDKVLKAFGDARAVNTPDEKGFQQVLTIIPEKINTFSIGKTEAIERVNQEQGDWGESTFFVNGSEVFRALIDPTKNVKLPEELQSSLNDSTALWMTQQLNLERDFPGDTLNEFA